MAATNDQGAPEGTPRKYQPNAGQCPKCGNFKTWEFRVLNVKSGKMMPGHIDAAGFKIGSGDCPAFKPGASKKASDDTARDLFIQPPSQHHAQPVQQATTQARGGPGDATAVVAPMPKVERVAGGVLVAIGNERVEMGSREAMHLCKEILSRLAGE